MDLHLDWSDPERATLKGKDGETLWEFMHRNNGMVPYERYVENACCLAREIFRRGIEQGKAEAKAEIRAALGVDA
jgi:hypothetical protein